jgi:hypothetical protein
MAGNPAHPSGAGSDGAPDGRPGVAAHTLRVAGRCLDSYAKPQAIAFFPPKPRLSMS